MTSRDFCYWLQGYLEISGATGLTSPALGPSQVECIQKHLAMVFKHEIDPSFADGDELDKIHSEIAKVGKKADEAKQIAQSVHLRPPLARC